MSFGLTRKQTVALTVTATILVVAVAVAWLLEVVAARDAAAVYRVAVVRDEVTVATLGLEQLRALPQRSMEMQGEVQQGPSLRDALQEAGVAEFDRLIVIGAGLRDSGRLELTSAEVDANVLLDFSSRGTVKVCGPDIAWEDRVRDVQTIEVR